MLKTKFEDIVNVAYIGRVENPIKMNDLLTLANNEQLTPIDKDKEKVLVIGIDVQQDFMDNGALGVPNACKDVENFSRFIYHNINNISQIAISLDTHIPQQIFHPCWWVDEYGNNPKPLETVITLADIDSGKWKAVINPIISRNYVENLEKLGKNLIIWTYHCLQGTNGCALENQFANMIYFHSVAKQSEIIRLVKGQNPLSEMYGIIKAEYDIDNYVNIDFLNQIGQFDKVIIGGEAKSHCVLESIKQILEYYQNRLEVTQRIYILEDCMSSIPTFEKLTNDTFIDLKNQYKVNIVKSTDLIL